MATGFESLVGWRYLFRQERRPKTLYTGLVLIFIGVLCVSWSVYAIEKSGMSLQLLGMPPGIERTVLSAGVGLLIFGGVISLFGVLYYRMTVFSAFSTFMVTIGVAEVVLVLGVMSGLHTDLRNNIISSDAHVQIVPRLAGTQIPDYKDIAKLARGVDGVTGAAPYLRTEVILDSNGNSRPAVLMGIETSTIEQANKLPEQIVSGCMQILDDPNYACRHWLYKKAYRLAETPETGEGPKTDSPPRPSDDESDEFALPTPNLGAIQDAPALLLGSELSMNLYSNVHMHVNVISPLGDLGPSGPIPRSRPFKNGGAFKSKVLKADQSLAYSSITSVQKFLGVGDVANGIQISVANLDDARPVRNRLRALMPNGYDVVDWQDRNSNLFTALEIERIVMFLVLTINILLAAFSITGTLVMTILERRREIAILMAMGSSSNSILKLFLSQGLFTGILGSSIGASIGVGIGLAFSRLGLPLNTDVYYIDAIPVDIRISTVLTIIAVAILVSMISTVYPARFASRVNPIEGLSAE